MLSNILKDLVEAMKASEGKNGTRCCLTLLQTNILTGYI